jgi:hypothetical protein
MALFLPIMYQLLALAHANSIVALLLPAFWMLMIFDCIRNERDRQTWLWLLIFLNVPGAAIYFFMRVLPRLDVPMPSFFKRWTLKQKLWNAEAAVRNIGKSHQHVALANLLLELREWEKARDHFQQALGKEPQNTDALWGISIIEMKQKQFVEAKAHLQTLLKKDPKARYGDASLEYGKTLYELQEWDAAIAHFKTDIREWSHPEASWMLAQIQVQQGQREEARDVLDKMLFKIKSSPTFHYKRHRAVIGKAERLFKSLQ